MRGQFLRFGFVLVYVASLAACSGQSAEMSSSDSKQTKGENAVADGDGDSDGSDPANAFGDDQSDAEPMSLTFSVDNTVEAPKLVDYVLVLDNSSSMATALTNAKAGLGAVISKKIVHANARVGVMSTMPAQRSDLTKIHPAILVAMAKNGGYPGGNLEPGFLRLTAQAQLEAFKASPSVSPTLAARWSKDLCDEGFFSPYALHPAGYSCLEAAMQTSFQGVGVEDGILSFSQMIERLGTTKLFRDGAEVNVVFISDVHAPGMSSTWKPKDHPDVAADLFDAAKRPSYASIKAQIAKANDIEKLTFHGIVPPGYVEDCTESASEFGLGLSYYELIDASGGLKQNVCVSSGYEDFFSNIVKNAQAKTTKALKLDTAKAAVAGARPKVITVTVDGAATKAYEFDQDAGKVVLDLTKLEKKVLKVVVKYSL
jgi:hypothetical protein